MAHDGPAFISARGQEVSFSEPRLRAAPAGPHQARQPPVIRGPHTARAIISRPPPQHEQAAPPPMRPRAAVQSQTVDGRARPGIRQGVRNFAQNMISALAPQLRTQERLRSEVMMQHVRQAQPHVVERMRTEAVQWNHSSPQLHERGPVEAQPHFRHAPVVRNAHQRAPVPLRPQSAQTLHPPGSQTPEPYTPDSWAFALAGMGFTPGAAGSSSPAVPGPTVGHASVPNTPVPDARSVLSGGVDQHRTYRTHHGQVEAVASPVVYHTGRVPSGMVWPDSEELANAVANVGGVAVDVRGYQQQQLMWQQLVQANQQQQATAAARMQRLRQVQTPSRGRAQGQQGQGLQQPDQQEVFFPYPPHVQHQHLEQQVPMVMVVQIDAPPEHRGLDMATVEANTAIIAYQPSSSNAAADDNANQDEALYQCTVCLDDFNAGDELRILPCLHRYHKDCIDQWLERSTMCPTCKHEVVST